MDKFFRLMSWVLVLFIILAMDFLVYDRESVAWGVYRFLETQTFWKGF